MNTECIRPAHILLPNGNINPEKWAVIACDQFTAEPEYWEKAEELVGDSPSALNLILPEVYLEKEDAPERIRKINETMKTYLADGTLEALPSGMMLTARDTDGACPRKGIVMEFDLEAYSFREGEKASIIPTEKTVIERIPARVKVREGAVLELPHIMILINDPAGSVIDPVYEKRDELEKKYDIQLMQNGGRLEGWFLPEGTWTDRVMEGLKKLPEDMPYAIGDGNHSLAAAKTNWENIKKGLTEEEQKDHPARFVLAELVNLYDESIVIEGIHRVLFGADPKDVLHAASSYFAQKGGSASADAAAADENVQSFRWFAGDKEGILSVTGSPWALPTASIQNFLDAYLADHPEAKLDYIHGESTVKALSAAENTIGFLLPDLDKAGLFEAVMKDGVLPRKTFSMGEAREKRYYMEARKITVD